MIVFFRTYGEHGQESWEDALEQTTTVHDRWAHKISHGKSKYQKSEN